MSVTIRPLSRADAEQLISWRYEPPYDMYNIHADDVAAEVAFYMDPSNQYAGIHVDDVFIGFCCFGADARVPGGDYTIEALDVGMGIRPDLTGRGQGSTCMAAVLTYALEHYNPPRVRATVAAFNKRAQQLCINAGMQVVSSFTGTRNPQEFVILMG